MNAQQFTAWVNAQRALGATSTQIAERIGIGRRTLFIYMQKGSPKVVDLAIEAVAAGLEVKGDE